MSARRRKPRSTPNTTRLVMLILAILCILGAFFLISSNYASIQYY